MMRVFYLLSEDKEQEDYYTKAKYLFRSKFNSRAVSYLEVTGKRYAFLSISNGLIMPEEYLNPYKVEVLSAKGMDLWAVLVGMQLNEILGDGEEVCLLYSDERYKKLEEMLERGYKVRKPIKNFSGSRLKILKLEEMIRDEIENRIMWDRKGIN